MLKIKKYVRVMDHITPGMVNATHRRFWDYVKDKALRVLWEDKTEVHVRDEEGEEYNIKKEFVEVVPKEALIG